MCEWFGLMSHLLEKKENLGRKTKKKCTKRYISRGGVKSENLITDGIDFKSQEIPQANSVSDFLCCQTIYIYMIA